MIDPATVAAGATSLVGAIGTAAKTAGKASEAVGNALETANKVKREIGHFWRIEDETISFNCPTGIVKYAFAAELKGGLLSHVMSTKLPLNDPRIRDIEVWSYPAFRDERDAVVRSAMGAEIHPDRLSKGTTKIRVSVAYEVDRRNFLRALVDWEHAKDGRETGDDDHYWMTAQLKSLKALKTDYGRIDLRDADFSVDVALQHVVKTAVPKKFTKHLEIQAALVREPDREKAGQLLRQNLKILQGDTDQKPDDILARVQDLFLPPTFKQYVEVADDFAYASSIRRDGPRGINPLADFPTHMGVISRTNLSLDRPCANGTLIYRRLAFQRKLEDVFPRALKD